MGPRPDGRGRPVSSARWLPTLKRQWGRDRMAAEGASVRACPSLPTRVNGAATGWPRKVYNDMTKLFETERRQWGRDRMAAEGCL